MDKSFTNKQEFEQYFLYNIDRAISEEWIKAYHQPLVRAASGFVSDEEAFARWEDPELGIFSPADFLPVLEREKLTYKLDLYMIERVLKKMKSQGEHGLFIVPESVNLARSDFESCDMVKEIAKRIDASGLSRDKLSVELSEETIATDVDFFKDVVERFQKEGIKVWMDDYGSGHSSLLILLKIKFNLLKIDKAFVDQIEISEGGRIILTEIIKTAVSLGMDTVAEGVETKAQADFLKEIGCSKLQGFYYTRPISLADIIKRNETGTQIGFENPQEKSYYEELGRVNLYDLSISKSDDSSLHNYFDTMPMAIFAFHGKYCKLVRSNQTFKEFRNTYLPSYKDDYDFELTKVVPGPGYYSFNCMKRCAKDGERMIIDDRFADGRSIQMFIRRIAVNPLTGESSVAVVVLSITEKSSDDSLTYNYIARALSSDYLRLYFVNLDTEEFTEYTSDGERRDISIEKHGTHYFDLEREEFELVMEQEDKKQLMKEFTKENVLKSIEKNGIFSTVTRIILDEKPVYVTFKAVKVKGEGNKAIFGLNNVDDQMKAREAYNLAMEERLIYSRIGALMGELVFTYTVDLKTMHYTKYNPSNINSNMDMPPEGDDFFGIVAKRIPYGIYKEDVDEALTFLTLDNILTKIKQKGLFENKHRLLIDNKPVHVITRATIINEEGEDKLIIGIMDVEERVRKEQEYEEHIFAVEKKANIDELTGIKNKHAYAETEKVMNDLISKKKSPSFAVAVFDINGLKQVNDTLGHQAGDKFIRDGCAIICDFFKHSPVFRIGGDEFVAILQGSDLRSANRIMKNFGESNLERQKAGDVVIAAGISKYNGDANVAAVFERADEEMYKNKAALKA